MLLREIIQIFGGGISPRLGITASTGIAAVNIGGTTIHSFAGIGLGKEPAEKIANRILFGPSSAIDRWRSVKVLIIDESLCSIALC